MDTKISIIMTSYNYAAYIKDAIESVIKQTYTNWELIIVDDASCDNSVEIINQYKKNDSRIKLIINDKNLGLPKSLKIGIENAESEWITFLESDDMFLPDSLEKKAKAISSGADLIFSDLELLEEIENPAKYRDYIKSQKEFLKLNDESSFINKFPRIITQLNIIPTFSVVMVKKSKIIECDFNPICKSALDYYLWTQLSTKIKIYYINKKLTYWRIHSDSYINRYNSNLFKNLIFDIQTYLYTVSDKNAFLKPLYLLNYIRRKFISITFKYNTFKIKVLGRKITIYDNN